MKFRLVLNAHAGTLRTQDAAAIAEHLAAIFRQHGHSVSAEVHDGKAAAAAVARLCGNPNCDAVIVGGGDGTVSVAAAAAAASGATLGVLPLGTMNLFARSLGVPLDLDAAAVALARAQPVRVDIGTVNGRFFVHHVSLGVHPKMVRVREKLTYASRLGKILANLQALWLVLREPPFLAARLIIDGAPIVRRTAAIVVSNNPFGAGHLPYADDLKRGTLGIYVSRSRSWTDLLQLSAAVALGDLNRSPLLDHWQAREATIELRRPRVRVSVDGEIVAMEPPLRLRLEHRGLSVLQPGERGEPGDPPAAAGTASRPPR